MNNKFILIGGAVVLGVAALLFFQSSQEQEESDMMDEGMIEEMEEEMGEMMEEEHSMMGNHVVVYSDSGYSPSELTITKGDTVTFRNEGSRETWPASAMHPSHAEYPGSSYGKCGTSEESKIFDACRGLKQGEEWSFVFNEVGTWGYHDHKMADMFGKIIVQE